MNFLLDRPFSDNAKVSSGPTVTPHSSPASAFASPAEVLLTGAFVIVAILSSLQGNPEKTHEQIQTVTVAPSAARGSAQPVLKSALMPPPTVTPRPNPTPRAGVPQETELENGSVDTETAQETAIIPQQTTTPAAVPQDTQLADGNANETTQKNPIVRVTGALKHLNPLARKKTPVVKTTK